ncbi:hypothetical protein [Burkholderia cenocepacia]|uniref:hypothetical protein n=1 Tax=Burkholderia cenocepacia TaxID=95486 RepID=UPI002653443F|nr:hypothetical protein [Burkholderia cenocepacia]MDN7678107.1 hypothetical protein [Burkholderia cenocepacia]
MNNITILGEARAEEVIGISPDNKAQSLLYKVAINGKKVIVYLVSDTHNHTTLKDQAWESFRTKGYLDIDPYDALTKVAHVKLDAVDDPLTRTETDAIVAHFTEELSNLNEDTKTSLFEYLQSYAEERMELLQID